MPRLAPDQIVGFLAEPGHLTRIATVDADGAPSVAPIWFLFRDGRIWFTPREKSAWWHHIQREPRVAMTIDEDEAPSDLTCGHPGCDTPVGWLQVDHREPAARGGPTDVANAGPLCGTHNRLKERGFVPVRGPDDTWTVLRPDGTPITPAV